MLSPSSIKNQLLDIISYTNENKHLFVNNPQTDMSRQRKCPFESLVGWTLNLSSHCMNKEILEFWPLDPAKLPTKSAVVQQRNKINDALFPFIFESFNEAFPFKAKWKGYHILACDGSDINLPTNRKDMENYMPYASGNGGYYQIHLNALYDIMEKRYTDIVVQTRPQMDERKALCTMIQRNQTGHRTIYICDRGYPSMNLMAHIIKNDQYFLFRCKPPQSHDSMFRHFQLPEDQEFCVSKTIYVTRSHKRNFRTKSDIYKCISSKYKFDFIDVNDKESLYELSFKIVCVRLDTGNYEYLITNLPTPSLTLKDFKELYSLRWSEETSFRRLKYALGLVYFHSYKRNFVLQELYARLIMHNFTALMAACAEKKLKCSADNKWEYRISFENAVHVSKEYLKNKMINRDVINLLQRCLSIVRPDRQAPRKVKSQHALSLNNRS